MSLPNSHHLKPGTPMSPSTNRSFDSSHPPGRSTPSHYRTANFIYAIDQTSTKLRVPMSAVEPTKALEDDGLVPGLCRLYMQGQCRQGEHCFQVHANPAVVEQLRLEAWHSPSCCLAHGATCDFEGYPLNFTVTLEPNRRRDDRRQTGPNAAAASAPQQDTSRHEDSAATAKAGDASQPPSAKSPPASGLAEPKTDAPVLYIHSLCPTRYLYNSFCSTGEINLHLPRSKVCRDHRKGLCRFGDECSFLHVCREANLGDGDQETSMRSPVAMRRPPTANATVTSNVNSYSAAPITLDVHSSHNSHFQSNANSYGLVQVGSLGSFSNSFNPTRSAKTHGSLNVASANEARTPLLRPVGSSKVSRNGSFSHNPYADAQTLSPNV